MRALYPEGTKVGLIGYSLGGGISFSLMGKYPGEWACFIGIAPYLGFATPNGDLPATKTAKEIVKFYPDLIMVPPLKNPVPHLTKYYADELQVK